MTKKQRVGLSILIVVVIYVITFGSKPDLTLELWRVVEISSSVLAGLGFYLFIY